MSAKIRYLLILRKVQKIIIIFIALFCCLSGTVEGQDTIAVAGKGKKYFRSDPMRATMLAVVFPGMGQIYNRKFWKVPFVYAGFGGVAYSINFNSTKYNDMMKAYQDFTDKIPETDSYIPLIKGADPSSYDPVLHPETHDPATTKWVEDNLLNAVDYYKRYRDLSYIGIAAWYLITLLDANVDASLANYDISDNLDVEIKPLQLPVPGTMGAGFNISLIFKF
jgi:hypothetical protein